MEELPAQAAPGLAQAAGRTAAARALEVVLLEARRAAEAPRRVALRTAAPLTE